MRITKLLVLKIRQYQCIRMRLTDNYGSEKSRHLTEDVPEEVLPWYRQRRWYGLNKIKELAGLELRFPSGDFNGDVVLTVNATSTDVDTGTTATATQDVTIHISPANDAPGKLMRQTSVVTAEDNSITLTGGKLPEHAVDTMRCIHPQINLTTTDRKCDR
ncbi:hypothetical protein O9992_27990 [Vibrio lentus]|nr:hypothetical protein [Vibrio lentus]